MKYKMPPGRYKYIITIILLIELASSNETSTDSISSGRALFSPRVDYNEWMPVGRGDPLKNDPTYDYSPPVLDRVRYWAADSTPSKGKEKSDILVLGVPSKKPSSRKETKYHPIRRNFYSPLPTRLMPPPMANQHANSEMYNPASSGWPSRKGTVSDASSEGFVSIGRPNIVQVGSQMGVANYVQNGGNPHPGFGYSNMEQPRPFETHAQLVSSKESHKTSGIRIGSYTEIREKKPHLHTILQKESTYPTIRTTMTSTAFMTSPKPPPTTNYFSTNSYVIMPSVEITTTPSKTTTFFTPTVLPPLMTTDSLFSHYKQPAQPLNGPMYLIIEGHSKVKTYGKTNDEVVKHPPNIVPIISTEDPVIHRVINDDVSNGEMTIVKHLHKKQEDKLEEKEEQKNSPSAIGSLLSYLDSSFGSFMLDDENESTNKKNNIKQSKLENDLKTRKTREVRVTHVGSSYQVENYPRSKNAFLYRKGTVQTETRTNWVTPINFS